MARRIKLEDHLGQGLNSLDSLTNLRAQKILTSHEATRLVNLSDKLKSLAHSTKLTAYEREREYENCLEEFRRLQEIVLRHGIRMQPAEKNTTSSEERLRNTIRDELFAIVQNLAKQTMGQVATRSTTPSQSRSSGFPSTLPLTPDSYARTATPQQRSLDDTDDQHDKSADDFADAMSQPSRDTTTEDISTDMDDNDATAADELDNTYALRILQQQGLQNINGRYYFNAQHGNFKMPYEIFAPNKRGYAESSFQKAMDFLFNTKEEPIPGRTGIDVVIYNIIQGLKASPRKDFGKLLKKYRNLKTADDHFKSMGTRKSWQNV